MTDLRQPLALLTLFGSGFFVYLWLGTLGVAAFGFGVAAMWATLGIATGYWVGTNAETELMITELMRRIRAHKAG